VQERQNLMFCPAPYVRQGGARPACCLGAGCIADGLALMENLDLKLLGGLPLPCRWLVKVSCIDSRWLRTPLPIALKLFVSFDNQSCISFFSFLAAQVCPLPRRAWPSSAPSCTSHLLPLDKVPQSKQGFRNLLIAGEPLSLEGHCHCPVLPYHVYLAG